MLSTERKVLPRTRLFNVGKYFGCNLCFWKYPRYPVKWSAWSVGHLLFFFYSRCEPVLLSVLCCASVFDETLKHCNLGDARNAISLCMVPVSLTLALFQGEHKIVKYWKKGVTKNETVNIGYYFGCNLCFWKYSRYPVKWSTWCVAQAWQSWVSSFTPDVNESVLLSVLGCAAIFGETLKTL